MFFAQRHKAQRVTRQATEPSAVPELKVDQRRSSVFLLRNHAYRQVYFGTRSKLKETEVKYVRRVALFKV